MRKAPLPLVGGIVWRSKWVTEFIREWAIQQGHAVYFAEISAEEMLEAGLDSFGNNKVLLFDDAISQPNELPKRLNETAAINHPPKKGQEGEIRL